ncbi:RDD family protein [Solirubrobacter ginsenosidimutans]|uniref:RDD family protein n=1 Tax=Solirubrobacter ginsenosidimutans TaxID=490573 RepID=A0A9X3S6V0_9ACTN|nr:RDD family protein [Solirubrobacter ginsenosidimutans]MDA0165496.1 RDD family protein [Solirubrobacter ginsenosidimutans]
MEYEDRRTISTPEGVQLALPLAGIGSRFMALLIDYLICGAAFLVAILAALAFGGETAATIVAVTAVLVTNVVYFVLFEVFGGGRTLGKRATGLRVVTDGGGQVGLRASLIRNILRLLELALFFYAPAIVSVLATKNNQRLGDLAAGTLVVRDTKLETVVTAAQSPPVSSERYASWDVTGVGEEEAGAVRSFLERRAQLRPGARRALAEQLAGRLRPRVAGAQHGLGDEAFLEHLAAAKARGNMRERGENGQ